jgi:hypothetical protein
MLDPSTFEYLKPTVSQQAAMNDMREAFRRLSLDVMGILPAGADQTYVLRKLRECAMWANVAITRNADGSPREV